MAALNLLAQLPKPGGLWPIIIEGINNGVGNFGWTLVIFTLIVKIAMSPLDFLMRWSTKKNTLIQKKLQPQVEKIQKKYKNDKQQANIATQALYKNEGMNMMTTCLFSIIYLTLTMVVFFTLFASIRQYSAVNVLNQYDSVRSEYNAVYDAKYEEQYAIAEGDEDQKAGIAAAAAKEAASAAAVSKWNTEKDGWLWISNIWVNDSQANPVPDFNAISKIVKNSNNKKAKEVINEINADESGAKRAEFDNIMGAVREKSTGRWNGYYILAVLSLGLTFLSQWISEFGNKVKKEKKEKINKFYQPVDDKTGKKISDPTKSTSMKILKYILPVVMVIFVITSSAAFGIYIVVSSLISILINLLINFWVGKLTKTKEQEVLEVLEKQEIKAAKKGAK